MNDEELLSRCCRLENDLRSLKLKYQLANMQIKMLQELVDQGDRLIALKEAQVAFMAMVLRTLLGAKK